MKSTINLPSAFGVEVILSYSGTEMHFLKHLGPPLTLATKTPTAPPS